MPSTVQILLAVLFGVAGWQHARSLERKYGAAAWGMPSWVWGIITGASLLLGLLLLVIAERRLKKRPAALVPSQVSGQAPQAVPAGPAGPAAGWQPDPSGKYESRWWDGQRWTSSVSTNGITGVDA